MAGHWDRTSAGEVTPSLRGDATIWPSSEQARTNGTTSYTQQAANIPLRHPASICRQKLRGGTDFTENSEKGGEGGWSQQGSPIKARVPLLLPGDIWKDILMSPHSTLPESPLHGEMEVNGSPHHPSVSAMQPKASRQLSPFFLRGKEVLPSWEKRCCRPCCALRTPGAGLFDKVFSKKLPPREPHYHLRGAGADQLPTGWAGLTLRDALGGPTCSCWGQVSPSGGVNQPVGGVGNTCEMSLCLKVLLNLGCGQRQLPCTHAGGRILGLDVGSNLYPCVRVPCSLFYAHSYLIASSDHPGT